MKGIVLAMLLTSVVAFAPKIARLPTVFRVGNRAGPTMKLKTGIVGLPNVGKSTLFNALTGGESAQAANFPFCTIDPNTGIVEVKDPRLKNLETIHDSQKVVASTLEFVDIAGIVKGASKGEGLGNKFLSNIRECDAIVHVVRCFDDDNIIHVDGSVDPLRDVEVINLELVLSDLEQVERRLQKAKTTARGKSDVKPEELTALTSLAEALNGGKSARSVELTEEEELAVKGLGLLSRKPVIYAANVIDTDLAGGNSMVDSVREFAAGEGSSVIVVSAQVESELAGLDEEERAEFLAELGVEDLGSVGFSALVPAAYDLLGLSTYFTAGPQEVRAWTIPKDCKAPQAAGVIHGDFERGFIRAETISFADLMESGSEKVAKEKGLMRSEGKDYVVQEGDVMLFRFNV